MRTRHRTRRVDFRGPQRPDEFVRYGRRTRWGQNRKNVYLSPYVEEPLNSKVIKKNFVPELRIRQVFFVFWDSCVLCIYVMNILCTFHTYPYLAMVHICIYAKLFCMSRMYHKVNFLVEFNWFEFRVFLFSWPVAIPKLKSLVSPIYPYLEEEYMDSYLCQGY